MKRWIAALVLLLAPARAHAIDPATPLERRLRGTLDDLAAFGWKRAGTPQCAAASQYVESRMRSAGLQNVHGETFTFPRFQLNSSALAMTVNGAPLPMAHDVFAYSGVGHVDADVVYVGTGHETDYWMVNAQGKVVMVVRDPTFHRSSQFRIAIAHGAAAMLYVSQAPQNLVQIGAVADPEDGLGAIPAVTVGKDDGTLLINAAQAHLPVHAVIDVNAAVVPATGRNVIGSLPGTDPGGAYLLLGAHYDTWQIGSEDNSTGVAVMLELAQELAAAGPRRFGLVFVGYDAEEPCLCGGYDYLRDHVVAAREPMLAFVNFEIPGSGYHDIRALGRTVAGPIDEILPPAGIPLLYNPIVDMDLVPAIFGGIIPTDIQGMYWYGIQGLSTACDTPWYHTIEDTPDKVDMPFLGQAVIHFNTALGMMDQQPASSYRVHDQALWRLDVALTPVSGGVRVDATVRDGSWAPQGGALVKLWVDVDDFTRVHAQSATADGSGRATMLVPASVLSMGSGSRWLHVTSGIDYPLAETIRSLKAPIGH